MKEFQDLRQQLQTASFRVLHGEMPLRADHGKAEGKVARAIAFPSRTNARSEVESSGRPHGWAGDRKAGIRARVNEIQGVPR